MTVTSDPAALEAAAIRANLEHRYNDVAALMLEAAQIRGLHGFSVAQLLLIRGDQTVLTEAAAVSQGRRASMAIPDVNPWSLDYSATFGIP